MLPFGLIIKSIAIGYVLTVLTNTILHLVFFGTPPIYWWLFCDDSMATILISLLLSPIGFLIYFKWMRYRQR